MTGGGASPEILAVALAATRRLDAEDCLETIARCGLELLDGTYALAYAVDSNGEDLECVAAAGRLEPSVLRREISTLDAGLIWHLAQDGPALVQDAEILLPTGVVQGLPELGQALLVPLAATTATFGLLLIIALRDQPFAETVPQTARLLAAELVPALDNLRTVASLRDLVIRDDTADCYNRRYLDHTLEDEVERARRFGGHLGLIFLDIDNLKDVNTHHGHGAGSRVLYEASLRISRNIRSIDRLFRYGGDEFVVLLPGTGLVGAREVAERIRRELAMRPFELPGGVSVHLTASAGVASWPEHGLAGRQVIGAADDAMRAVKSEGKNAVGVAPSPGLPGPSGAPRA
jgi:diguanylate cyclase (GGDEF)-like protein